MIQNGPPKSKILKHLACHSAAAFGFYKKNGVRLHDSPFYFQNLKTEFKNLVSIKSYGGFQFFFRKIFSICTKKVNVIKIMRIWELIGKFFQKLSWCSTTAGYPYLEIWAAGKNYPRPRAFTDL